MSDVIIHEVDLQMNGLFDHQKMYLIKGSTEMQQQYQQMLISDSKHNTSMLINMYLYCLFIISCIVKSQRKRYLHKCCLYKSS